jgi:penicillin-binding protein 2
VAAIANGGKVLRPRLVREIAAPDPAPGQQPATVPIEVRGELGVKPSTLSTVREAMRAEVEDGEGTGKGAAIAGFPISGKTGTAQKKNERGVLEEHITWFASFAPFDQPRYTVIVMVEGGSSGGNTCAPVAHDVYTAILERERKG